MDKLAFEIATVDAVRTIESRGPWDTKSGGKLNVLFGLGIDVIQSNFFKYELSELDKIPADIRGLRTYIVSNLVKGGIGANEWHRIRNELVLVIKGSVKWTCEDLYGNKKEFVLDEQTGIWTPPFILHTYEAIGEDNQILVINNTLFLSDDPRTHDTYSIEEFRELQALYR